MVQAGTGQEGRQLSCQTHHRCGTKPKDNQIRIMVHHVVVYVCTTTMDCVTFTVAHYGYHHCVREMLGRWLGWTITNGDRSQNIIIDTYHSYLPLT